MTGESAPVIRESGGDRSAVTGGTVVLSDRIKVRVTSTPGSSFLDRMIALVEGANRQKTPNELALSILLSGMTLIFLIAVVTLWGLAGYSGTALSVTVLVALLVTLIPTTIGGLLSAIGIAGMDRLIRFNVMATWAGPSRRPATSIPCCSTRRAPSPSAIAWRRRLFQRRVSPKVSWHPAPLFASVADETPEGRSIVSLAKGHYGQAEPKERCRQNRFHSVFSPDSHVRRRYRGRSIRKGAVDAVLKAIGTTMAEASPRVPRGRREHRTLWWNAARRGGRRQAARRHPSQGRRQARHQGAVRRASLDGHPHGHGDRRQSRHNRRHRLGGWRRRLHRRGDATGQACLYQGRAGQGTS